MLELSWTTAYKKDLKRCAKQGHDLKKLENIINILRIPKKLPDSAHEHRLSGNYMGFSECHIEPDWLLIFDYPDKSRLRLVRMGSHQELFSGKYRPPSDKA